MLDALLGVISGAGLDVDLDVIERAFACAAKHHAGQKRKSGEEFIVHPCEVAKIVVGLSLDTETIAAALLHDVVEDTDVTIEEITERFGDRIAALVEGVTNLTRIHFVSRERAQIQNYRRMVVAMARDYRVILIKLADRLHNMRTIRYLSKQRQIDKAKETVEIFAPIAHRLGIHSIKWELEDLSFAVLYPRKYAEIQQMVQQRRADRERLLGTASDQLRTELASVGIEAEISGRTKHFYSIFQKMQRKGKEFNEIYDLTGIRVLVNEIKDCYGAIGIIHSLWTPMPGRFKDYIAVPKLNGYQSLHTTVVGPSGNPLELQIRTFEMHRTAELGIAAHFAYKDTSKRGRAKARAEDWLRNLQEWEAQAGDEPSEFMEELRLDLSAGEVFVFTPKGEVRGLAAGATPLDFAYAVHTDVGHRCVGAKVNGRIVPLTYTLQSGDRVEVLTSNQLDKGPSRDWMHVAKTNRAKAKIRQWFAKEKREDFEQRGRESLTQALKKQSIPHAKIQNSSILASIIRDMGFRKAEDFYIALGSGKFSPGVIVNKVIQQLKTDEAIPDDEQIVGLPAPRSKQVKPGGDFGIAVEGIEKASTVAIRMAKCCMPVPGDRIKGYISLGKGITIHREDCPNAKALMKNPERFTPVHWDGDVRAAFRIEIQVDGWDRVRLLEDISRTISEHGANIVQHSGVVLDQMVKERFTVELGDVGTLRSMLTALRNIDSVFDAYRVTPS